MIRDVFSAPPLIFGVDDSAFTLPVGKMHGVMKGAQFIPRRATPPVVIVVLEVEDFTSIATAKLHICQNLLWYVEALLFQWVVDKTVSDLVESGLSEIFQKRLCKNIHDMVGGDIEFLAITEVQTNKPDSSKRASNGDINIFEPTFMIGHEGAVRGLAIPSEDVNEEATRSALALAHLLRFKQIVSLRNETPRGNAPFQVILDPAGSPGKEPIADGTNISFQFKNTSPWKLFLVIMCLDSGFSVEQIFPPRGSSGKLEPGGSHRLMFSLRIPDRLKAEEVDFHREIIRIIVTNNNQYSFSSLELPYIRYVDRNTEYEDHDPAGYAAVMSPDCTWWIKDHEFRITKGGS